MNNRRDRIKTLSDFAALKCTFKKFVLQYGSKHNAAVIREMDHLTARKLYYFY